MRNLPGKTTVEVHDYADTRVPMLTCMHGKRLTVYKRIGFTNPVICACCRCSTGINPRAGARMDD